MKSKKLSETIIKNMWDLIENYGISWVFGAFIGGANNYISFGIASGILIGIVIGFTIKRYDPSNKKNQIIGKAA